MCDQHNATSAASDNSSAAILQLTLDKMPMDIIFKISRYLDNDQRFIFALALNQSTELDVIQPYKSYMPIAHINRRKLFRSYKYYHNIMSPTDMTEFIKNPHKYKAELEHEMCCGVRIDFAARREDGANINISHKTLDKLCMILAIYCGKDVFNLVLSSVNMPGTYRTRNFAMDYSKNIIVYNSTADHMTINCKSLTMDKSKFANMNVNCTARITIIDSSLTYSCNIAANNMVHYGVYNQITMGARLNIAAYIIIMAKGPGNSSSVNIDSIFYSGQHRYNDHKYPKDIYVCGAKTLQINIHSSYIQTSTDPPLPKLHIDSSVLPCTKVTFKDRVIDQHRLNTEYVIDFDIEFKQCRPNIYFSYYNPETHKDITIKKEPISWSATYT
jgi:hypothetical protein